MITLENQLWLWVEDCEARKPARQLWYSDRAPDKAVRVLQYEVREGTRGR